MPSQFTDRQWCFDPNDKTRKPPWHPDHNLWWYRCPAPKSAAWWKGGKALSLQLQIPILFFVAALVLFGLVVLRTYLR